MACADNEVIAVAVDFDVVVDIAMVVFVVVAVVADAVEIVDPSS